MHPNYRWSKGVPPPVPPDRPTHFELEVERLGLNGDRRKLFACEKLRKWAERNRDRKYIPEWLLNAWGLELWERDINLSKGN